MSLPAAESFSLIRHLSAFRTCCTSDPELTRCSKPTQAASNLSVCKITNMQLCGLEQHLLKQNNGKCLLVVLITEYGVNTVYNVTKDIQTSKAY